MFLSCKTIVPIALQFYHLFLSTIFFDLLDFNSSHKNIIRLSKPDTENSEKPLE